MTEASKKQENNNVLKLATQSAFRGGLAGATAQGVNVLGLMWLRTTMNHQYRYGGGTRETIKKLWAEGGVRRFYRGLTPALIQSPLSRFGDTAANVGVLHLLDNHDSTKQLPVAVKTGLASCGAAGFRFFLMPIDAWKTTKQVEGKEGLMKLVAKGRSHGIHVYYHGAVAAMTATWVGHYPWFFTHNWLSQTIPQFDFMYGKYARNALIGFCSSVVSDTCSNSIRVLKTTRQTAVIPMTYPQALRDIVSRDGIMGLLGRGLQTRILTNGISGMVFSVGWKAIQQRLDQRAEQKSAKSTN